MIGAVYTSDNLLMVVVPHAPTPTSCDCAADDVPVFKSLLSYQVHVAVNSSVKLPLRKRNPWTERKPLHIHQNKNKHPRFQSSFFQEKMFAVCAYRSVLFPFC